MLQHKGEKETEVQEEKQAEDELSNNAHSQQILKR